MRGVIIMQTTTETKQTSISWKLEDIASTLDDCIDNQLEGCVLLAARIFKEEFNKRPFTENEKDQGLMFAASLVCLSIERAADTLREAIVELEELAGKQEPESL